MSMTQTTRKNVGSSSSWTEASYVGKVPWKAQAIYALLKYSRHFFRRKGTTPRSEAVVRLNALWQDDPEQSGSAAFA